MFSKLEEIVEKYKGLELKMADPEVAMNPKKMIEYNKVFVGIEEIVEKYTYYKKIKEEYRGLKEDSFTEKDLEMKEMMVEELNDLEKKIVETEEEMKLLLLPKDPNDAKNVIVEIRSGAGGDEAALFAAALFRMYSRYAERSKWKIEIIDKNEMGIGGLKEIVFMIKGIGAYSKLKYESGVHRVQRVPSTESAGRIHTSTATVAVLPEVEAVEVDIKIVDLKVDTYRASGAGGQHVNVTDSAVRITHLPTGTIVSCQDERSQMKNKEKAMKVLAAKLYDLELGKQSSERDADRKLQVGSGSRSEKIRTYNYPQGRVTDHRIKLTLHKLDYLLDGDLTEMIEALITFDQTEKLKQAM